MHKRTNPLIANAVSCSTTCLASSCLQTEMNVNQCRVCGRKASGLYLSPSYHFFAILEPVCQRFYCSSTFSLSLNGLLERQRFSPMPSYGCMIHGCWKARHWCHFLRSEYNTILILTEIVIHFVKKNQIKPSTYQMS